MPNPGNGENLELKVFFKIPAKNIPESNNNRYRTKMDLFFIGWLYLREGNEQYKMSTGLWNEQIEISAHLNNKHCNFVLVKCDGTNDEIKERGFLIQYDTRKNPRDHVETCLEEYLILVKEYYEIIDPNKLIKGQKQN
jgi:hypothetical protein